MYSLLREPFRKNMNGRVLSRFRMLFMAEFRQRFSPLAIAEMRGVSDENGESPSGDGCSSISFGWILPKLTTLPELARKPLSHN